MDEEIEFQAERNAFERVTFRGESIDVRTPLGSFLYALNERFDLLQHRLGLSDGSRFTLQEIARTLPDPQYKNPSALVYAYKVVQENRISRTALAQVSSYLDFGVELGDVIRYARLILNTN
jgi:Family of unknown function (DUF5770)